MMDKGLLEPTALIRLVVEVQDIHNAIGLAMGSNFMYE